MFLSIKWQPVLFMLDLNPKQLLKLFCQVLNCTERHHITDSCNCTINYQLIRRGQYPIVVGIFGSYQWLSQNKSLSIFSLSGFRMQFYLNVFSALWAVEVCKYLSQMDLGWKSVQNLGGQRKSHCFPSVCL